MNTDKTVRDELLFLLRGGNAHMPFAGAVKDFPLAAANTCPPHLLYTPWHLLEHIRIAQRDILDFIVGTDYHELRWPDDYWPARDATADAAAWQRTISQITVDNESLQEIVADPATDLYTPLSHGTGQNILREVLVVADHNAYHIGEFAILRQVMGTWRNA
jgi:hypothetical protein